MKSTIDIVSCSGGVARQQQKEEVTEVEAGGFLECERQR
jgi:hypothetical protein